MQNGARAVGERLVGLPARRARRRRGSGRGRCRRGRRARPRRSPSRRARTRTRRRRDARAARARPTIVGTISPPAAEPVPRTSDPKRGIGRRSRPYAALPHRARRRARRGGERGCQARRPSGRAVLRGDAARRFGRAAPAARRQGARDRSRAHRVRLAADGRRRGDARQLGRRDQHARSRTASSAGCRGRSSACAASRGRSTISLSSRQLVAEPQRRRRPPRVGRRRRGGLTHAGRPLRRHRPHRSGRLRHLGVRLLHPRALGPPAAPAAGWNPNRDWRLAIHGGATGAVSAGCVHADEATLRLLMRMTPLGTPVTVEA